MAIIGKTPGGGKRKKSTDASKKLNKIKKDNRSIKPSKDKPIKKAPKRPPRKINISLGQKGTKRDKKGQNGSSEYPYKLVHAANERLRKLEKVSKMAESSSLYQNMKRQMYELPNKGGKFFQPGKEKGTVRFIGKKKFEKLSEEEQKAYLKRLTTFMQSDLSTASGLKKVRKKLHEANKDNEEERRKSYETFRQRPEIQENYPDLTFEQYTNLFHAYQYYSDVKGQHFNYEDLTLFLENVDLDKLEPYQIEEAMSFVKDDNWGELVDRGWLLEF